MLELSDDDLRAIMDALDLAVRTNGLRASVVALPIAAKIEQEQIRRAQPTKAAPLEAVAADED